MSELAREDRIAIVIDTDPGIDDAFAILYCLGNPRLDVRALTTTAGNASVETVTRNARYLLHLAGREDIRVGAGSSGPHEGEVARSFSSHGEDGLGGAVPREFQPDPPSTTAVEVLRDEVRRAPAGLVVLAIGPMTNLAAFAETHPDDFSRIARVVAMGGAFTVDGNATSAAEFNAWADPGALAIVLATSVEVVMVPLEVTQRATLELAALDVLPPGPVADLLRAVLAHYAGVHVDQFGTAATHQHDAVAAAALTSPAVVQTVRGRISVECDGPGRGTTSFTPARDGRHQIATAHSQTTFEDELLRGLAAAARPTSSTRKEPEERQ